MGDLFIDEVLSDFTSLPKLGEESFARKFRREIGGGAANTACGLAKLGWRVAALGVVGKEDGESDQIKFRLSDCEFEYGDFRDEESAEHKFEGFLVVASAKGDTLSLFEPKG